MTSSGKIMRVLLVVAALILLISVYRSCRGGSRPPAESGTLNETSAGFPVVGEHEARALAAAQVNIVKRKRQCARITGLHPA